MQTLNYCRQMRAQFSELVDSGMFEPSSETVLEACIEIADECQKFILPKGGFLLDDKSLKGLDENSRLNLPFNSVALEYESEEIHLVSGDQPSTKRIVFAKQTDWGVSVLCVAYLDNIKMFHPYPPVGLSHSNFINREVVNDGFPAMKVHQSNNVNTAFWREEYKAEYVRDCSIELRVLLGFLSALSCSNVRIEKRFSNKSAKTKSGIPFDDYHVLTVDLSAHISGSCESNNSHRSPREHLRRGHIRHLSDGRRIWINATVVCTGKGFGVVHKDYRIK